MCFSIFNKDNRMRHNCNLKKIDNIIYLIYYFYVLLCRGKFNCVYMIVMSDSGGQQNYNEYHISF